MPYIIVEQFIDKNGRSFLRTIKRIWRLPSDCEDELDCDGWDMWLSDFVDSGLFSKNKKIFIFKSSGGTFRNVLGNGKYLEY
jgi:hypothetical protein